MNAPRPWTPADTERLRELHGQGLTLTAIGKAMDRSKAIVSRYAATAGLSFDRSQVQAATAARVADAQGRRAALQLGLLEDAEKLRAQLWEPCVVFNFGGKDNTYEERRLDKPTFADQLKIVQAAGAAIDRALRLDLHDKPEPDKDVAAVAAGQVEAEAVVLAFLDARHDALTDGDEQQAAG